MQAIKCVVVGDGGVGKTCLLERWCTGIFPEEYMTETSTFEHYESSVEIAGNLYHVEHWDMIGSEDYDNLRRWMFPQTDVVLICFSLASPTSFVNVRERWYPEVMEYCSGIPVVLVGTKMDLRDDPSLAKQNKISRSQGRSMAKHIGASEYLESSALTNLGLKEVFHEIAFAVLDDGHEKNDFCAIL